ncbi:DNA helicase RecQ [Zavarzinia sp. CC-PAN008]|uniref:DNA helicase RecQ n=1 Tax=Zavarzinia sp. CC-PAN008 TaxID=3243332 RepID=UPI003F7439AA
MSAVRSRPDIDQARAVLARVFGYPDFRAGQDEVVSAVLAGEDVLAVMPTGAGKSLCYQLPALLRDGLTIVASPLIALMRDQVLALRSFGIAAAALHSGLEPEEARAVFRDLRAGTLRLLYAAPERLVRRETLETLAQAQVSLLAVDEAHCVSQWGHDFRPEYLELGAIARSLADPGGAPLQTLALTATADPATRAEIASRLFARPPRTFVRSFDRPNLRIAIAAKDQRQRQIAEFVAAHKGQSGIVYCATRDGTEQTAAALARAGVPALAYHAGLSAELRAATQDRFQQEDGIVVAATIAFGMGIDKPDVRFVAHGDLPKSIEAYYQEIGRAGRDGLPADTLMLHGANDVWLRRRQIAESTAAPEQKAVERQRLDALLGLLAAPTCRRQTLLAYFGEQSDPCGNCDLCSSPRTLTDGTVPAQKFMSAMLRTGERFGTEHLVQILRGRATEAITRLGHDALPTFGVGADLDAQAWRVIVEQLYSGGLIDRDDMGAWALTERGRPVLKGQQKIHLHVPTEAEKAPRRRGPTAENAAVLPPGTDLALLDALKAKRLELAKALGAPAYVVFSDRSLIDMAAQRPRDLTEFSRVHGVGAAKLSAYGPAFLDVLKAHPG